MAKCWITKEDTVLFGHIGQHVTFHSTIKGPLDKFAFTTWYHETNAGRLRTVSSDYLSSYNLVAANMPNYWNVSYTLKDTTATDSGRYFPVQGRSGIFSAGSSLFLVVTGESVSAIAGIPLFL